MNYTYLSFVTWFTIGLIIVEVYHHVAPESWCWLSERQLSGLSAIIMGAALYLIYKLLTHK